MFSLSPAAVPGNRAGDSESREKQIAMIAQKIIYANHPQEPGRRFVTASDARALTLWTARLNHFIVLARRRFGGVGVFSITLSISRRARSSSISRPMRSA